MIKIVVTVGMPGSGKSSHPKVIGEKYGFPKLETGEILLDEMKEKNIEITIENVKKYTKEMKEISDSYFTEKLIEKVEKDHGDKKLAFLSGIRAPSEVELLKKEFGKDNVFVIAFLASQESRYQRVAKPKKGFDYVGKSTREEEKVSEEKNKEDELLTKREELAKKDEKDLTWGVGNVIALADYYIVTESEKFPHKSWKDTNQEFEKIVKEILNM